MKQALIVLGMHRSGTSAVAGALARLGGAAPANLMPAHDDNPKGYWESEPLVRLNDRILAAAGSSWHDWRTIDQTWFGSDAAARFVEETAAAIEKEFPGSAPAVLKDPRICRLMPLWVQALERAGRVPIVLTPLRRPAEVARSLAKRDSFSLGRAYLIWLRHVLEAEHASRGTTRLLFRWSDFMSDWRGVVDDIRVRTGADLQTSDIELAAEVDGFLDGGLRRQKRDETASDHAPEWIAPAFDALTALAQDPGDSSARDKLDEIRFAFDRTAAIYGPIFDGVQTEFYAFQNAYEGRLAEDLERARHANAEMQASLAAEREAHAAISRHRDQLAKEIHALNVDRHHLGQALAATEQARADTERGWTAERAAAATISAALSVAEAEVQRMAPRLASAIEIQEALEEELTRVDRARLEGREMTARLEAQMAIVQAERDTLHSWAELLDRRLNRLLARRRGRPIRTAWAILRGREA